MNLKGFAFVFRESDSNSTTRARFVKVGHENDGLAFLGDSYLLVITSLLTRQAGLGTETLDFLCICILMVAEIISEHLKEKTAIIEKSS